MEFREACSPYLDQYGLFKNRNFEIDGNPWVYAGCRALLLHQMAGGPPNPHDVTLAMRSFAACDTGTAGIYHKKPLIYFTDGKVDQTSHDDVQGMAAVLCGLGIQNPGILRAMQSKFWRYDNITPDRPKWSKFMLRMPGVSFVVKLSAGEAPGPLDVTLFVAGVLGNVWFGFDGTCSAIRQWMAFECWRLAGRESRLISWALKVWRGALLKKFKRGMADVFAEYHGPDHPFARFSGLY